MRILHLIGNGFDKAQGLNTSYPEFYSWLHSQKPLNAFEEKIYNEIKGNYATWADLEKALGQYSKDFTDPDEFRSVIRYFNTRLKEYLSNENERAKSLNFATNKFVKDLCNPQALLEGQGWEIYQKFAPDYEGKDMRIDVVTFNYTSTFEVALGDRSNFGEQDGNYYRFYRLLHIHGKLDDMILVGVDNEMQIANDSFRTNENIRDEFIKPEINEGCLNTNNATFSSLIKEADIIVLFGLSIGITDNIWWHLIGERLDNKLNRPLLLYIPYDPNKDTNGYIDFFKERMDINLSVEELRKHILVGINKDFLKLV